MTDEDQHNRINQMLIGPLMSSKQVIDEQAGFTPPSWWKGDDHASRSGMAAMMTLKK